MSGPVQRPEHQPDPGLFRRLLGFLNRDREEEGLSEERLSEQRGLRYEEVRRELHQFFDFRSRLFHLRDSATTDCEELVDRTFDRVMEILRGSELEEITAPAAYVRGVGKNIYHEWVREQSTHARRLSTIPGAADDPEDKERAMLCLDQCMAKLLKPDQRTLITEYYCGEKRSKINHRQKIAQRHNMNLNTLRIQCCRIRGQIRECVLDCVGAMK